ncbi:hypothetical protein MSA03_00790 [Microbacterium saccharophilum]|nr:hypothetical protein MSA03_00790 [Microbacterium saccharophilum]
MGGDREPEEDGVLLCGRQQAPRALRLGKAPKEPVPGRMNAGANAPVVAVMVIISGTSFLDFRRDQ